MFKAKWKPTLLKTQLKLAITRLKLLQRKHDNESVRSRKEIADLLKAKRVEIAKIRVEQLIRDDYYREALEILETYATLILARFGLVESVQYCEPGLRKAVCSLVWATPRVSVDVTEFKEISRQFSMRYGKDFVEACMANSGNDVCDRVIHKLSFVMPDASLINGYLSQIALKYGVEVDLGEAPCLLDENPPAFTNEEVLLKPAQFPPPQHVQQPQQPQQQPQQPQQPPQQQPQPPVDDLAALNLTFPAPYGQPQQPTATTTNNAFPPPPQQQHQPQSMYPPNNNNDNPTSMYPPEQSSQFPPTYTQVQSVDPFVSLPGDPPSDDPVPNADLLDMPLPPGAKTPDENASVDFDELTRRYHALHKK